MIGRALMAAVAVSVPLPALAQQTPARPALKSIRYEEDWRALCAHPERRTEPLDALKCIDLGNAATLTLGGDLRERMEWAHNPGFGRTGTEDAAFLHRAYLHADLHVGSHVRVFTQFAYLDQSSRARGPGPFDTNRLDLSQGFVDLSTPLAGGDGTIRIGRQELSFGSGRLLSVRDGANARLAFDAIRGMWRKGSISVDTLFAQPVAIGRGTFDDDTNGQQALWGVHATLPVKGALKADIYYLGYRNRAARYVSGTGREERHSIGVRLFGKQGGWDWDVEGIAQFGNFAGGRIGAWTIASDTGFTIDAPLRPRIGLKADIASGDHDPNDKVLGTFNALYPKLPYFSDANLVAPANFYDLQPGISLQPAKSLTASLGWDALWRESVRDAIYVPPALPFPGTAGRPGRYIGDQIIFGMNWKPAKHLEIAGQFVHFNAGSALRAAGGRNTDFVFTSIGWRF